MSHSNPSDPELKELLTNATTIAIVGASSNPDKAPYGIMQKLQKAGYKVIPINPRETEILGERSYPSLIDVPERIELIHDRADGLRLAQIDSGAKQQRHWVIAAAGLEQREVTVDRRGAIALRAGGELFHQLGARREAGRVLIHVVRRAVEVRNT